MSEAVREATPVEVLERDLNDILSRPLKEEEQKRQIKDVIAKAMCYEQDFLKRQYVVLDNHCKDLKKENEVLRTQNRVLAEYIHIKEEGGKCSVY